MGEHVTKQVTFAVDSEVELEVLQAVGQQIQCRNVQNILVDSGNPEFYVL